MKKIKYINNFTDGTGWAKAGTYNALALSTLYDVTCEERKYNNNSIVLEDELPVLINKSDGPFEYTVHHVLPTDYIRLPNTINVGFLPVEASISNKQWLKNINMMDFLIVPDHNSIELLEMSGIKNVKKLPHYFNYDRIAGYPDSAKVEGIDGSFNFLFVGEFSVRKNVETLLRAFYTEFDAKENVNLLIKTNGDASKINQFCENVKQQCRKNSRCKTPIVITGRLSEQDLVSITRQCHAFITASHGEAWCYPALESMACGLDVIYPYYTGIHSYALTNYFVRSSRSHCYGAIDAVEGLYTCQDWWTDVDLHELMRTMRKVVSEQPKKNASANIETAKKYDYKNALGAKEVFG